MVRHEMQTPGCLKNWTPTCPYAWKHPDREYRVSYAICGDKTLWDAWYGQTTKTAMPEQVDGGLETAALAIQACKQHAR